MGDLIAIGFLMFLVGGGILVWSSGLSYRNVLSEKQEASSSAVGTVFLLLGFLLIAGLFFVSRWRWEMNSWDFVYILAMVMEVAIEAYQIGKKQGKIWVNIIQMIIYLASFLVYLYNRGNSSFPFGIFLRVTVFAFVLAIILEVKNFSMENVENKLGNLILSGLKFLPLILLFLFLTEVYM